MVETGAGGLAISNLGACALFAAISGSSPATCAVRGKMGIPEMRKRGYPDGVAAGSIAAGGTLGILIPPSVTMIVYGIATETSIGRLFLVGVIAVGAGLSVFANVGTEKIKMKILNEVKLIFFAGRE